MRVLVLLVALLAVTKTVGAETLRRELQTDGVVFYGARVSSGNLGGQSGADRLCDTEGNRRGLSGLFVSFMSWSMGRVPLATKVYAPDGTYFGTYSAFRSWTAPNAVTLNAVPSETNAFGSCFGGALFDVDTRVSGKVTPDCNGYTSTAGNTWVYNYATRHAIDVVTQTTCTFASDACIYVMCFAIPPQVATSSQNVTSAAYSVHPGKAAVLALMAAAILW